MANLVSYPETLQFRNCIVKVNDAYSISSDGGSKALPVLNFTGTVKIHGANTAIGYSKEMDYWCQSRNTVITPNKDFAGFAQHIYPVAREFLRDCVFPNSTRICEHYENGDKIIIYGEWCGANIQRHIALCGLPEMFVIFKVKIIVKSAKTKANADTESQEQEKKDSRTYWLNPNEWKNIKAPWYSIYNIFDFQTYNIDIDFNKPELSQDTLIEITEQVERQCPVGVYFNRIGVGEGVVWTEWAHTGGNLNFKVKGRKHLVSQAKSLVTVEPTKLVNTNEFVEYACTNNRMLQALDYMHEQGIPLEMKNLIAFVRWLAEDICKEEKDTMNESNINPKDVSRLITKKAETWFINRITRNRKMSNKQKRNSKK